MIKVFLKHTDCLFTTSLNKLNSSNPKSRDHRTTKTITKFNKTVREVKFIHGIIRSRLNSLVLTSEWQVELFGKATKITSQSI